MKNVQIRIKYTKANGVEVNTTATVKDNLLNLYSNAFFGFRYNAVKKEVMKKIRETVLEDLKDKPIDKNLSQIISSRMMRQIGELIKDLKEARNH